MSYKEYLEKAKTVKLSDHFTLYEVAHSDTAVRLGIDNTPAPQIITNAGLLIKNVLEKVRIYFKKPIEVHCMFRCLDLNRKIGSKDNSQHITGQAADFTINGINDIDIVNYIRHNLEFDQLILEQSGSTHWVHVSYSAAKNRKQVLKYDGRKYVAF